MAIAQTAIRAGGSGGGTPGQGVPTGGTTGQVLAKASETNYDTIWTTASSGGSVDELQVALISQVFG